MTYRKQLLDYPFDMGVLVSVYFDQTDTEPHFLLRPSRCMFYLHTVNPGVENKIIGCITETAANWYFLKLSFIFLTESVTMLNF